MKKIKYILIIFVTGIASISFGQDTVFVGNKFHVTPGTLVKINNSETIINDTLENFGNVVLNSLSNADKIFNSDTIRVQGNWINNSTGKYDPNDVFDGTVVFNGTNPQLISQGANNGNFNNIVFAQGGAKNINGIVIVDSSITFVNGIVNVANTDTLALLEGDVNGGSSISHVRGMFYQQGYGQRRYPVGGIAQYREATLENIPNSGDVPIIGMQFSEVSHTGTAGTNVQSILNDRFWVMNVRSGTYLGSPLTLRYRPIDGIADSSEAVVVESSTINGVYNSIGNGNILNSDITSEFLGNDKFYTLGQSANMNADVAALLQENYNGISMHDSLFDNGLLNQYLFGDTGIVNMLAGYTIPVLAGNGPVDIISLYLRTTASGTNQDTTYAWLMTDGSIRDFYTGTNTYATFSNYATLTSGDPYYVVVDHRNHLPVMYNLASNIDHDTTGLVTFDVTDITNVYGAGAFVSSGKAQLFSGNADTDATYYSKYVVDAIDLNVVADPALNDIQSGVYVKFDVNLDGDINATDWTVTKIARDNFYYSTVPF